MNVRRGRGDKRVGDANVKISIEEGLQGTNPGREWHFLKEKVAEAVHRSQIEGGSSQEIGV